MVKDKLNKYIENLFLLIYMLFSFGILYNLIYTNSIRYFILYVITIAFLVIFFRFRERLKNFFNKKIIFILCISMGIIIRIALPFFNYNELVGVGDYQTFFYNASNFCNTNTIAQTTYVGLFPYLMPYIVILGSFFKVAGISYQSVTLLNIILDLFIPLFLYLSFKNKGIGKCVSVIYMLNPFVIVWCTVCCPITLVNFGIALSILVFSILLRNINSRKFILFSLLTGIIMAIANSFRPIMPIMLIAIFLYYIYINIKNKKANLNYLISFILILASFLLIKNLIFLAMDKINGESVSRTSGWTLYIGSNLDSDGMWYSEPKLDELLNQGLSVEDIQKEFKKLAIERYKSNGINNYTLFWKKFVVLTSSTFQYTLNTLIATINLNHQLFYTCIKIILYLYIFLSAILNILISIQGIINRKSLEVSIFYMLFYIGMVLAHLFVEVSPRYYMPATIPLTIINSISLYKNLKFDLEDKKNMIKVITVFGTRPEAIKMAPLVKELKSRPEIECIVCVTAQHRQMLDQVLNVFDIVPDYDLDIMKQGQTLSDITSRALKGLEEVINKEKPNIVLVHGDTTTTFAGALAAYYCQADVGHVEAGLRTWNKYSPYPEEMNRQMVGVIADMHFAPTEKSKQTLLSEGKNENNIYVTGNTAIDALATTIDSNYSNDIFKWVGDSRLILLTAHRRENLGEPMRHMFKAIKRIVDEFSDVKVIYPVHLNPRVKEVADEILGDNEKIRLISPLEVIDFHNYLNKSYIILTDSGGIQEEAPSLGKPVLVLRDTTERPEGIDAGTLKLAGTDEETIYNLTKELLTDKEVYDKMSKASNPYGDGKASKRIADAIIEKYSDR